MMKPIKFDEANNLFIKAADMSNEECGSLWTYNDGKQCLSCWKLSFKDRIKALIFGKVWLCIRGKEQPPVWLDCAKTVFEEEHNND